MVYNEFLIRWNSLSPAQTIHDNYNNAEEAAAGLPVEPTSTCFVRQSAQPQSQQTRHSNVADSEKWACKVCTYLNWPRSLRCVQCCTKRGAADKETNEAGEALQALRISGSDTELNATEHGSRLIGAVASNSNRRNGSPSLEQQQICSNSTHLNNIANTSQSHQQQQQQQLTNQQQLQQQQHPNLSTQQKLCHVAKWACNVSNYDILCISLSNNLMYP